MANTLVKLSAARRIGVTGATLLLAAVLAGCGSSSTPAADTSSAAATTPAASTPAASSAAPESSAAGSTAPAGSSTGSGSNIEADTAAARALLPKKYVDSGKLSIATNLAYAPYSFKDEAGKPAGIDIEVMTEVTRVLGLQPVFEEVAFPSIIPALQNGRYDVGVDEMADTAERREAVSFADYWKLEYGVVVGPAAPADWTQSEDLCGRSFGQTNGSAQVALLDKLGAKCEAEGKQRPKVSLFPDTGTTFLALENGRVHGYMSDKGNTVHQGKQLGPKNFRALNGIIPDTKQLAGIAFNKDNGELGKALVAAIKVTMADGSYQKILANYGLADSNGLTPDQVGINGG